MKICQSSNHQIVQNNTRNAKNNPAFNASLKLMSPMVKTAFEHEMFHTTTAGVGMYKNGLPKAISAFKKVYPDKVIEVDFFHSGWDPYIQFFNPETGQYRHGQIGHNGRINYGFTNMLNHLSGGSEDAKEFWENKDIANIFIG